MSYPILDTIQSPADVKQLPEKLLPSLCNELRAFIVDHVSETGGHLASSLGAIELIVALHRVYDFPEDKLIFDVGHQAYAHKILTGRRNAFSTLRQEGGLSGFPKREESAYDAFNTGHASTSISAALGLLRAAKQTGSRHHVACLIGDGALTGGLAYEAMDDAGESKLPLVVVLNDNEMSIARNVGALSKRLAYMRSSRGYNSLKQNVLDCLDNGTVGHFIARKLDRLKNRIKRFLLSDTFFEDLGFIYLGPINGHDVFSLIRIFSEAREMNRPVLVHTVTLKGKGYSFAEENPQKFHGVAPFYKETGELRHIPGKACSAVFAEALCRLAEKDERICAITAAMPEGTGLDVFAEQYKKRFFDVGIAEEHAVTMAAGMAAGGLRPVVAIYSSFLQRATDEIYHDVCLQKLPVVFAVDRAGLVGADGETHNGLLDISVFQDMPNMEILAPSTYCELCNMLAYAVNRDGPTLIRYNRGSLPEGKNKPFLPYKWEERLPISTVTVLCYGALVSVVQNAMAGIENDVGLISADCLFPMDSAMLHRLASTCKALLVAEEGPPVLAREIALHYPDIRLYSAAINNVLVQQGTVEEQRRRFGLDEKSIRARILQLREENR